MFEETFGYLIMEIEEKAELFMETGAKLGKARNEMRQSIELANALSEKYGAKYTYDIASAAARPYSKEEIDSIKAELLDNSIITIIKRFFGFGKKTGAIFAELMEKLTGLIRYLRQEITELEKELEENESGLRSAAKQLGENAKAIDLAADSSDGQYLKFGNVIDRIDAFAAALSVIQSEIPDLMNGDRVALPYARSTEEPFHFAIQYSQESDRLMANALTRSLLYQLIRKTTDYQRVFHLIDGAKSGTDFGELISLQRIRENNVWNINASVTGGYYQYANVYFKSSEIRACLKTMDEFISNVATEAGSYESFRAYNMSQDAKDKGIIPQQIVNIHNFPSGFQSDEDFELLAKLINNGQNRGISVLIQYDASNGKLFEEKLRSRLDRAMNDREELLENVLIQNGTVQLIANDYSSPISPLLNFDGDLDYINALIDEKTKIKVVDNTFSGIYKGDYPSGGRIAIDGLRVPFAIDRRGNIKDLVLDSKTNINCLISGTVGSGKTTLLHCLILTISMYYRPEEVEIWLADYKIQEFNTYKLNAPPNIPFIGLSDTDDFTYAFLDKILEEYKRRISLFVEANDELIRQGKDVTVNDFRSYRKHVGDLPRLIIIVDEFHLMSQHVTANLTYRTKLENLLSQARGAGITFIFSDQAVTNGLAGLTPKAKNQMNCRLALANSDEELKEMLRTNNAEDIRPFRSMKSGDCILVTDREVRLKDGSVGTEKVMEQVKVIYLDDADRPEICRYLKEEYGQPSYMPRYVDQSEAVSFSDEKIDLLESNEQRRDLLPVYFGESLDLSGMFRLSLEFRRAENIMCVGGSYSQQIRLIVSAIRSFQRIPEHTVYIMADSYSKLISQYRYELNQLCEDPQTFLFDEAEDICEKINELLGNMRIRRKEWNILVLWIGLDEICSDFQNYSDIRPERYRKLAEGRGTKKRQPDESVDLDALFRDTESKWNELFGGGFDLETSEDEKNEESEYDDYDGEEEIYNATDDIVRILREGSKRGIFNMAVYDSVFAAGSIRSIRLEFFKHKMSFVLGKDDCLSYFGRSNILDSLNPESDLAAYYDGRSIKKFKPFALSSGEDS